MFQKLQSDEKAIFGSLLFITVMVNVSIALVNDYVLNGAFGPIGRLSFGLVLGLSAIIGLTFRRRYYPFVLLLLCLIGIFWLLKTRSSGALIAYQVTCSLLVMFASGVFFLKNRKAYELLLKTFVAINLFLLILQFSGVSDMVHMWNSYFIGPYNVLHPELGPTLFVDEEDLLPSLQLRSPGLFYSNAVTAGFLIMAIGHRIGGSMRKFSLYDLIIIVSVFFCLAKICILFLLLVAVIRYLWCDAIEKAARRKFLLAIPIVILLYYMLFPAALAQSVSIKRFYSSVSLRLADMLISLKIEEIPLIGSDSQSAAYRVLNLVYEESSISRVIAELYDEEASIGKISGYKTLMVLAPLSFILLIMLKRRLKNRAIPIQFISRAKYLLFGYLFCYLAIPILGSMPHVFLLGPAMTIFFYNDRTLSKTNLFRQSADGR